MIAFNLHTLLGPLQCVSLTSPILSIVRYIARPDTQHRTILSPIRYLALYDTQPDQFPDAQRDQFPLLSFIGITVVRFTSIPVSHNRSLHQLPFLQIPLCTYCQDHTLQSLVLLHRVCLTRTRVLIDQSLAVLICTVILVLPLVFHSSSLSSLSYVLVRSLLYGCSWQFMYLP